eukprot:TRINITY_DN9329_c0_g1_i4.p1 TRINITY_DN9329_c0_g1~~TRINITY_DN9329_c0_g1_i4.p1  ORF type:complete len:238 (+),score=6.62 TRINITY_DN9329_c0_g1_i4:166-879(+)
MRNNSNSSGDGKMVSSQKIKILTKKAKKQYQLKLAGINDKDLPLYIEKMQKGHDMYTCTICSAQLTGALGIYSHLQGSSHQKKLYNFFQNHHWDNVITSSLQLKDREINGIQMDSELVWKGITKSKLFDQFYCQVCNKTLSHREGAFAHLEGQAHQKLTKRPDGVLQVPNCILEKIENISQMDGYREFNRPPPDILKYFCKQDVCALKDHSMEPHQNIHYQYLLEICFQYYTIFLEI